MTKTQYKLTRMAVIIVIALTVSTSLNLNNYIAPVLITIAGIAFMFTIRKKYEKKAGVLADERDYKVAGDAARYTLLMYALVGALSSMVLMVLGKENETLMTVGYFTSYTVCGLMLLNALLFRILINRNEK